MNETCHKWGSKRIHLAHLVLAKQCLLYWPWLVQIQQQKGLNMDWIESFDFLQQHNHESSTDRRFHFSEN